MGTVTLRSVKGSALTHTEMDNNFTVPFRGALDGLILTNGTDSDHDIDLAVGMWTDSTNVRVFTSSALTKQIDANWVAGTAAGGFPSALTLAINTTYHFFVIAKTDATLDAGWDTSLSATNLLSDATGYTLFRRIGSMYTDGSSNIIGFSQIGDEFLLDVPSEHYNTSNPGTSLITDVANVPTGIQLLATERFRLQDLSTDGTTPTNMLITSPDQTDTAPTAAISDLRINPDDRHEPGREVILNARTDTSGNVRFRLDESDADISVRIMTRGWIDTRGKE